MRLHDCVVVADTSRGLTCHTRSASAPHYSLRHWSPSRVAPLVRAARLHRHASGNSREPWADTGDARASLHLRSALTGLSFPTGWEKVSRSFHSLSLFFLPSRFSASHALFSLLFAVCRAIASRSASLFSFPLPLSSPRAYGDASCARCTSNILDLHDALQRLLLSVLLQVCDRPTRNSTAPPRQC